MGKKQLILETEDDIDFYENAEEINAELGVELEELKQKRFDRKWIWFMIGAITFTILGIIITLIASPLVWCP